MKSWKQSCNEVQITSAWSVISSLNCAQCFCSNVKAAMGKTDSESFNLCKNTFQNYYIDYNQFVINGTTIALQWLHQLLCKHYIQIH